MPANTSNGLPYPLGTDPLAQGDDAIKALADALNARIPYRFAYGLGVAVGAIANGANANIVAVYPVGLFTVTPLLFWYTGSNRLQGAVTANSPVQGTIQLANFSGAGSGATTLQWMALQMPL